jgi:hypothetical protein
MIISSEHCNKCNASDIGFLKNKEDGLVEKTNYMRAPEFS